MVFLNDEQIKKWDKIKFDIMEQIMLQKFTQIDVAANVLKLTRDAEMWHGTPRVKATRMINLENVRKNIF